MGHNRQQNICRIDKNEGPVPELFADKYSRDRFNGWDFSHGPLIYASKDRNCFQTFFTATLLSQKTGQPKSSFRIFVKEGSDPITVAVGRYKGRTEKYDPMDYLHARRRLTTVSELPEDSMRVGVQGHRISVANAYNTMQKATEFLDPTTLGPVGAFVKMAVSGPSKYFVAFTVGEHKNIVHMQEDAHHINVGTDITFQSFWTAHGQIINGFLRALG